MSTKGPPYILNGFTYKYYASTKIIIIVMGGETFSPPFENKIKGETLIYYVYLVEHDFKILKTGINKFRLDL